MPHSCGKFYFYNRESTINDTSIQEAFFQLTEKGLSEQSNILLTDTRQQPSRFFYLVPWSGTNQGVAQKELEKTIGLWETNKIGFYIEPDLFRTPKDAADLLRSALHQIIEKAPFNDYFLLIGNNARAQLIVEALQVREALVNMDEDWQITVFH